MRHIIGVRFRFGPFSLKQRKLLTWWMPQSPYRDHDMVIADGSVRSGKTIATIDGFITWALATFENENFILAG
ncbi:MAG: PBSX family phage terminase large subunit, partial [Thermoleophilia bacterium]|nr:PBSX family phage terminase large subunit [Thermoleophilia bacterium]